jgi:phage shock protein C
MDTTTATPQADHETTPQQLRRPVHDRMIAGVAAGIAQFFDVDVTIVRIAIAVLTVFGGAGIALYIAGWLLMPNEGTDRSIANQLTGTNRQSTQS